MESTKNQLLARLPAKERVQFMNRSEFVDLKVNEVLSQPGDRRPFVYFPTAGIISVLGVMDSRPALEIGMVGTEGMLGAHFALGEPQQQTSHTVVMGDGHAWRMLAGTFERELARSPSLRRAVYLYLLTTMAQLATCATCMRFHNIEPRLSRWLLMTQDRVQSQTFGVTHQVLASMLGVRRVGVTTAAASLQRQGLIQYRRGEVVILRRRGLMACACSCYEADRSTYSRLLS